MQPAPLTASTSAATSAASARRASPRCRRFHHEQWRIHRQQISVTTSGGRFDWQFGDKVLYRRRRRQLGRRERDLAAERRVRAAVWRHGEPVDTGKMNSFGTLRPRRRRLRRCAGLWRRRSGRRRHRRDRGSTSVGLPGSTRASTSSRARSAGPGRIGADSPSPTTEHQPRSAVRSEEEHERLHHRPTTPTASSASTPTTSPGSARSAWNCTSTLTLLHQRPRSGVIQRRASPAVVACGLMTR